MWTKGVDPSQSSAEYNKIIIKQASFHTEEQDIISPSSEGPDVSNLRGRKMQN